MPNWLARLLPYGGILLGPEAWLVSTQTNYSLAASLCGENASVIGLIGLGLVIVSLAGSLVSVVSWRQQPRILRVEDSDVGVPLKFISGMGALMGLLFAAVIALQASALLFLQGCAR
jgi:hypothetical protein